MLVISGVPVYFSDVIAVLVPALRCPSFLSCSAVVNMLHFHAGRGEPEDSAGPEDSFGGSAVGSEERGGEEERAPAALHQR